jgi:hypothetical protein
MVSRVVAMEVTESIRASFTVIMMMAVIIDSR